MNRHERRAAAALHSKERAESIGAFIRDMNDAMGVIAALIKKAGGSVEITSGDFPKKYAISEDASIPGVLRLSVDELSADQFDAMLEDRSADH